MSEKGELQSKIQSMEVYSTDSIISKRLRSRSDPEKFSGSQQNTEKIQMMYKSWKIQIQRSFISQVN